jgi:hypothetical protein
MLSRDEGDIRSEYGIWVVFEMKTGPSAKNDAKSPSLDIRGQSHRQPRGREAMFPACKAHHLQFAAIQFVAAMARGQANQFVRRHHSR